jgi:hypothetical protein
MTTQAHLHQLSHTLARIAQLESEKAALVAALRDVIVTWEAGNPAPFDAAFKRARAALAAAANKGE